MRKVNIHTKNCRRSMYFNGNGQIDKESSPLVNGNGIRFFSLFKLHSFTLIKLLLSNDVPFHTAPFTSSSFTSYVYISIFDCYKVKRQNRYYSPVIVIQRFNSSLVAFYRMSKSMWKKYIYAMKLQTDSLC